MRSSTRSAAHSRGDIAQLTAAERDSLDCLAQAFDAGTAAELDFTLRTTEGDPIRYWVRVLSGGNVEQFTHSDDEFGEKGWFLVECSGLTIVPTGFPTPTGCGEITKL